MLLGPRRIGIYCSPGKHGLIDREAWWASGEPCEVVAAYGIDPVLFMLGAQTFGANESELDVAGGIMGRPVELTDADYVRLPIPAHAELVIEGVLHPGEVEPEGPLGEFTGYYGRERSPQPVIDVKAVHMRRSPILTAALMAKYPSCEIGAYYAIMRSARILDDLERIGVPGVVAAYAHPAAASGWGMVVVAIRQHYAGHAAQVLALAAQCPAAAYYTKWVIVVDEDVDPTDFNEVLWALSTRCHPAEDIDLLRSTWLTGLDPSQYIAEDRPYGSKALINACKPHRYLKQFPPLTLLRRATYERVAARWSELGFTGAPPKLTVFHPEQDEITEVTLHRDAELHLRPDSGQIVALGVMAGLVEACCGDDAESVIRPDRKAVNAGPRSWTFASKKSVVPLPFSDATTPDAHHAPRL